MKAIIFDSSTIINFVMNGLISMLKELKKEFNGKFLITEEVKHETIDRPLGIKKYELGALYVLELLKENVLELPESIGLDSRLISRKSAELLEKINHSFSSQREFIHLIDKGECSCLALSMLASEKKIDNIIAIDERTTRMLWEKPENLCKLMEKKLHTRIKFSTEKSPRMNAIKFIRSSEIAYIAWKKRLVHITEKRALEALLYATKFKGASISSEEIEELKNIG